MNDRRESSDPRETGGRIFGPGGPLDRGAVIVDSRNAVKLDYVQTAVAHVKSGGKDPKDIVAMVLSGDLNRPDDAPGPKPPREHVENLYLMPWEAAANIIVDLLSLAARDGRAVEMALMIEKQWSEAERQGLTEEVPK